MRTEHHIKRLKTHRNVLYFIVVLILIFQIMIFVAVSSKVSKIVSDQDKLKSDIYSNIEEAKQQNQVGLDEILKIVSDQKTDFQSQIQLLKDSQADFSGVIESAVKGVVSIRTEKSIGSGFIVDPRGYIVTNYHVIDGASVVRVAGYDGKVYDAQIVNGDPFSDLALLKISGENFDYLALENSDDVQIGEEVIAIGNPLGLSFTVTEGIVSARDREGPNGLSSYIQTDVTLNPGNSGGPLIDKQGKVIGVNNFKIGGAESLGFALESNVIKQKINEFTDSQIIE